MEKPKDPLHKNGVTWSRQNRQTLFRKFYFRLIEKRDPPTTLKLSKTQKSGMVGRVPNYMSMNYRGLLLRIEPEPPEQTIAVDIIP